VRVWYTLNGGIGHQERHPGSYWSFCGNHITEVYDFPISEMSDLALCKRCFTKCERGHYEWEHLHESGYYVGCPKSSSCVVT